MPATTRSESDPAAAETVHATGSGACRGPVWWVEALAAALVAAVYLAAPSAAPSAAVVASAERRARRILEVERMVGLDIEAGLQGLLGALQLQSPANWLYGSMHFGVTAAAFVLMLRCRPARYRGWRTAFVVASVAAFTIHKWVPVAPPRLVPDGSGSTLMADWLAEHPTLWSFESGPISEVANHYAALPSMHVGWAVLSAVALAYERGPIGRSMAACYPVVVSLVVMATGNHFVLDVMSGAGLAGISLLGVELVTRWSRSLRGGFPGSGAAVAASKSPGAG